MVLQHLTAPLGGGGAERVLDVRLPWGSCGTVPQIQGLEQKSVSSAPEGRGSELRALVRRGSPSLSQEDLGRKQKPLKICGEEREFIEKKQRRLLT